MAQQPVVLQLPESLYERVRQIADESNRPVEEVLLESLTLLFDDLPNIGELTPQRLGGLSDEQLWAIVYRPLAWIQDVRLHELTARSKWGGLSENEQSELEQLVDQMDQHVLLRSQALLLLKQRGIDVEHRLQMGT